VNDHPLLEKRLAGTGPILSNLEWDVKSYFILGGTLHDAAISAWSVKGWYDYIRPISAIRYMSQRGQSSNPNLPNYDLAGIPLIPGFIELINEEDPLVGVNNQNLHKIKLYSWRGHSYINDPEYVDAGVGWILAEDWLPYQRISFVTPPFAGYVSGHSTFSRAAAEAMTLLTGDEFFPGGMAEFYAPANEFLVFEEGPSQDVILQWASYRDASDQCSLSRMWGGIHPPADDIPGRLMGAQIGTQAYHFAVPYFSSTSSTVEESKELKIFPNPISSDGLITIEQSDPNMKFELYNSKGNKVKTLLVDFYPIENQTIIRLSNLEAGMYFLNFDGNSVKFIVI